MQKLGVEDLKKKAQEIRREIIRMLAEAGSGHPGGSLSATDILACLFFNVMNHDPKNPKWADRDRFVISKGHGAPAVYATLALAGYFPKEELLTLRKIGSRLQGHPDVRKLPMLEASTGSLGQGLSAGIGMALARRIDKKDYYVYVLLSDGETNEGQTWEAAAMAAHHKIDHLIAILDYNKFQLDGAVKDIIDPEPLRRKWESFRWHVQEIDGHDVYQILQAIQHAKELKASPHLIIAHTVKGKGVSFMENNNYFHGVAPTGEEAEAALKELEGDPSLSQELIAMGRVRTGGK